MAGAKGRSGGARPGAGRKRKVGELYASAFDYLTAVATGIERNPSELRVAAARALLPFEAPKRRAALPSMAPRQMALLEGQAEDAADADDWKHRAEKIRQQHEGPTDG